MSQMISWPAVMVLMKVHSMRRRRISLWCPRKSSASSLSRRDKLAFCCRFRRVRCRRCTLSSRKYSPRCSQMRCRYATMRLMQRLNWSIFWSRRKAVGWKAVRWAPNASCKEPGKSNYNNMTAAFRRVTQLIPLCSLIKTLSKTSIKMIIKSSW